MMSKSIRRFGRAALVALLSLQLVACGTVLYPERQGQGKHGRLDPAVLLLDGALLIAFVIPGLVAYAVDFHTGAIYLPGSRQASHVLPEGQRTLAGAQALLSELSGTEIRWDDPRAEIRALRDATARDAFLREFTAAKPARTERLALR